MYQEWFEKYENIVKKGERIVRNAEIRECAKELYELKEQFKKVGFTEAQSFNLLQTLISLNNN